MDADVAGRLATNIAQLREGRGLTQQQMARVAGVPRATWAHLESGQANPTLAVLNRAAAALQVTIEELIRAPRPAVKHFPASAVPIKMRGLVAVRKLLPDPIPGMEIDRMELPAGARLVGIPHVPGTTEYLTCERGEIVLVAAGESWRLAPGDVVVFRGDQKHSYANPVRTPEGNGPKLRPADRVAVGYSVVVLARVS
jgi:transcriptional regulator with XRE-family HTH domain